MQDTQVNLVSLTDENRNTFIEDLSRHLSSYFSNNIPENYGFSKPWSLLSLIKDGLIDTYQLLYVDGEFWAGSGGIVRELNGRKVYQAAFRGFSNAGNRNPSLGQKFYLHKYNTVFQISRAKELGCKSVVLSFNEHNYRLFRITNDIILPKSGLDGLFVPTDQRIMFNGVPQWLLVMDIDHAS